MQLGFIGLGHLGKAIAGRLVECGHELSVWNRTPGKAAGLQAKELQSPADVAAQAEIIHICLFDSAGVHQVLTGEKGLLKGDVRGRIIIDHSTNHFGEVLAFHELCAEAGAQYLEAPVLGSVVPAQKGLLTVLVSGDEAAYDTAKPVLDGVGSNVFHLGAPGQASRMKLINNLALGGFMAILGEAVAFAESVGIDKAAALDILDVGGGQSLVLNAKKAKMLQEDFSTHFSAKLIYKDLHCLQDLAYSEKRPLYTATAVKELFARAIAEGMGELDFSAVYAVFKNQIRK